MLIHPDMLGGVPIATRASRKAVGLLEPGRFPVADQVRDQIDRTTAQRLELGVGSRVRQPHSLDSGVFSAQSPSGGGNHDTANTHFLIGTPGYKSLAD